jgi:hypothetical protein
MNNIYDVPVFESLPLLIKYKNNNNSKNNFNDISITDIYNNEQFTDLYKEKNNKLLIILLIFVIILLIFFLYNFF